MDPELMSGDMKVTKSQRDLEKTATSLLGFCLTKCSGMNLCILPSCMEFTSSLDGHPLNLLHAKLPLDYT